MSTQNLSIASNRDGSRGEVLASMSENIGVVFIESPRLSERNSNASKAKGNVES